MNSKQYATLGRAIYKEVLEYRADIDKLVRKYVIEGTEDDIDPGCYGPFDEERSEIWEDFSNHIDSLTACVEESK